MKQKRGFFNIKRFEFAFAIVLIIFIVLVSTLFFLGVKLKFAIDGDFTINLKPLEDNFFISNKDVVYVNFTIKNNNYRHCSSYCKFKFIKLKDNSVMHSSNKTLKHNEVTAKGFILRPPKNGAGQLIYVFEVECRNIKSIVCPSKETLKYKSSIITVNYGLTAEDKSLKNTFTPKLEELVSKINGSLLYSEENSILMSRISNNTLEKEELAAKNNKINRNLNKIKSEVKKLLSIWKKEDYLSFSSMFSDNYLRNIIEFSEDSFILRESTLNILHLRNEIIDFLIKAESLKDEFPKAVLPYVKENNPQNFIRFENLNSVLKNITKAYEIISSDSKHSEENVNNMLNIDKLKVLIEDFRNITAKGLFLSIYGDSLVSLKNKGVIGLPTNLVCDNIRSASSRISYENNKSYYFRKDNYNWSLDNSKLNKLLDDASKALTYSSLLKIRYIASSLDYKDLIIGLLDKELADKNYSGISVSEFKWALNKSTTITIPVEDIYKMALLEDAPVNDFLENYCNNISFNKNISKETIDEFLSINFSSLESFKKSLDIPVISFDLDLKISDNLPKCCAFNECRDCGVNKSIHPVLFIHGHILNKDNTPETSMNAFSRIQEKLQEDGFINAGELDLSTRPSEELKSILGLSKRPVTVRASFYYIINYRLGSYVMSAQKSERIENYALRLAEIISLLKFKTGAEKVDIIAHSMGGLVVREYINIFSKRDINKIITVNCPNYGISKRAERFCSVLGASKECDDMSEGSIFLNRLNSKEVPEELYVIRSVGCGMGNFEGDGIVKSESAFLEGAINYLIRGNCTDSLNTNLHTLILNPELYPETYELIKEILIK